MPDMPVTLAIIVVTCIVSWQGFSRPQLINQLILWPPAISRQGEYWRLASCGLIHADLAHLAFNMITLYFFGGVMEHFYGRVGGPLAFAGFYLGGLVVSSLPSWWRHRDDAGYRSLGASGAVSAVLFAFILLDPWSVILVFFLPMPAILFAVVYLGWTIYMDRQRRDRIDHLAHLSGAIYGIVVTLLSDPRVVQIFLHRLARPSFHI